MNSHFQIVAINCLYFVFFVPGPSPAPELIVCVPGPCVYKKIKEAFVADEKRPGPSPAPRRPLRVPAPPRPLAGPYKKYKQLITNTNNYFFVFFVFFVFFRFVFFVLFVFCGLYFRRNKS